MSGPKALEERQKEVSITLDEVHMRVRLWLYPTITSRFYLFILLILLLLLLFLELGYIQKSFSQFSQPYETPVRDGIMAFSNNHDYN